MIDSARTQNHQIQQKSLKVVKLIMGKEDAIVAVSLIVGFILEALDESQRFQILCKLEEAEGEYVSD